MRSELVELGGSCKAEISVSAGYHSPMGFHVSSELRSTVRTSESHSYRGMEPNALCHSFIGVPTVVVHGSRMPACARRILSCSDFLQEARGLFNLD